MQLKVIHLFNYFQKLEQELEEIETLKSKIQDSRSYSSRVRLALHEEVQGLRALQNKILTQTIKDPPPFIWKNIAQSGVKKNDASTVEVGETAQAGVDSTHNWSQEPVITLGQQTQPTQTAAPQTAATKSQLRAPDASDNNSAPETAATITASKKAAASRGKTKPANDAKHDKVEPSIPLEEDEFRFRFNDT